MIISEIFEMPYSDNLTKNDIEKIFQKKNIFPIKWAITGISEKHINILTSYEKKN